ncbi:unnamed protein product [Clavelina lepadiformis]|uniref:DNA-dependent metalloprotease SPRTN n=1 Tax=Clavelina lepadiformis TaxID=159417 RepID=A0ABP0GLH6_CLALP
MEDVDYALAMALQDEFDAEETGRKSLPSLSYTPPKRVLNGKEKGLIDPEWELVDPNPDIHSLFAEFNKKFFWNKLTMVEVRWSPRMTLCAGICCYEGHGGLCSVRLSQPLLKLRPRRDLVETLLHEMIHAYLFVTDNNKDHDGHGPEFCKHMHRINNATGTNITIYHNFHDEVAEMRKHWWRCTGLCRNQPPYFGYVKRAMNRAPSSNDFWWAQHQSSCGGTYEKIKEPEDYNKKKKKDDSSSSNQRKKSPKKDKIDSTQRTLSFTVLKSPDKENGRLLGGKFAKAPERSNRGIPLHSKLLEKFNNRPHKSPNSVRNKLKDSSIINLLNRKSRTPTKVRPFSNYASVMNPNNRMGDSLLAVCKQVRRTGEQSVNLGAPAFNDFKVVTKFLTLKEKRRRILFTSDDELGEDGHNRDKKDKSIHIGSSQKENKSDVQMSFCIDEEDEILPSLTSRSLKKQAPTSSLFPPDARSSSSSKDCQDPSRFTSNGVPGLKRKSAGPCLDDSLESDPESPQRKMLFLDLSPTRKALKYDVKSPSNFSSTNFKKECKPLDSGFSSFCKSRDDGDSTSDEDDNLLISAMINHKKSLSASNKPLLGSSQSSVDIVKSTAGRLNEDCHMENIKPSTSRECDQRSNMPLCVSCPVCCTDVPSYTINQHIDMCLSLKAISDADFY